MNLSSNTTTTASFLPSCGVMTTRTTTVLLRRRPCHPSQEQKQFVTWNMNNNKKIIKCCSSSSFSSVSSTSSSSSSLTSSSSSLSLSSSSSFFSSSTKAHNRPFVILGIQQIALGSLNRKALTSLWIDVFGLKPVGSYQSSKENVDEIILRLGGGGGGFGGNIEEGSGGIIDKGKGKGKGNNSESEEDDEEKKKKEESSFSSYHSQSPHVVEVDLMTPLDPDKKPRVHDPPLNHIGLWVDDLPSAVIWMKDRGVRFTPRGIRKGASGYDVTFIHPKGNEEYPIGGAGALIELVQAPPEVIKAMMNEN